MSDLDYTSTPTRLRIWKEDCGDEYPWHIDGTDNEGNYTEDVRRFATFKECINSAEVLVVETTYDGVKWEWDVNRPKEARQIRRNK